MSGLADMMSPQKPDDGEMDSAEMQRLSEVSLKRRTEPQDVDEFRRGLIKQTRWVGSLRPVERGNVAGRRVFVVWCN